MATLVLAGCSSDDGGPLPPTAPPPEVLTIDYNGTLTLRYQNTAIPVFNETANLTVHVDRTGKMTIESGALIYDAEEVSGGLRVQRTGTITVDPSGAWDGDGGEDVFIVSENCQLTETMTKWSWNGNNWEQTSQEVIEETWDHDLLFHLEHALGLGSVVAVATNNGAAIWTLRLSAATSL